jgi:hypothetical protein
MGDKDFRQAFKKAEKTENELLKYYKKYFVKHTIKLQKLYASHLNSLKNIDGSIGGLNSMSKIFQENIPNAMKKKNITKKDMQDYIEDNNLKLQEYIVNSNTSMIDFSEQHIKKQIKRCMGDILTHNSDLIDNIKSMHVLFMDKDDDDNKLMTKENDIKKGELYFLGLIKRKKKIEGANIVNRHHLNIKLVLALNDGRYISANIPHKNNFKIVKDETYTIVKNLVMSTLPEAKRMSVKTHLKKQDEIVKTMIFEEQKKQLEVQLQDIEKDKDNKKILLNIVKRINQASEIKLEDDPYYRQQSLINLGDSGRRLNNNSNNYLNRKAAQELTKPLSKENENNNENEPNFKSIVINKPFNEHDNIENDKQLEKLFKSSNKSKKKSSSSSKKSKKKSSNRNNNL